jgi:hypothetical protein
MVNRKCIWFAALAGIAAMVTSSPSVHAGSTAAPAAGEPQLIDDAELKAISVTMGGADVLPPRARSRIGGARRSIRTTASPTATTW